MNKLRSEGLPSCWYLWLYPRILCTHASRPMYNRGSDCKKTPAIRHIAVLETCVSRQHEPLLHYSTIALRGLSGALNWDPILPRDISLLHSECKFFPAWSEGNLSRMASVYTVCVCMNQGDLRQSTFIERVLASQLLPRDCVAASEAAQGGWIA